MPSSPDLPNKYSLYRAENTADGGARVGMAQHIAKWRDGFPARAKVAEERGVFSARSCDGRCCVGTDVFGSVESALSERREVHVSLLQGRWMCLFFLFLLQLTLFSINRDVWNISPSFSRRYGVCCALPMIAVFIIFQRAVSCFLCHPLTWTEKWVSPKRGGVAPLRGKVRLTKAIKRTLWSVLVQAAATHYPAAQLISKAVHNTQQSSKWNSLIWYFPIMLPRSVVTTGVDGIFAP